MRRKVLLIMMAGIAWSNLTAQSIYKSRESDISFFAGTSIEDISAATNKATSFLNIETGEVVISIPMNSFEFRQSLMQEHFNENYIESDKFPKGEFKGKILNISAVNWDSQTPVTVTVEGFLTIHGISKPRTFEVMVSEQGGKINALSGFKIALADHNIDRPKILWEKLANEVEVKVKITYEVYKSVARH